MATQAVACGQGLPLYYRDDTDRVTAVDVGSNSTVGDLIAAISVQEGGAVPALSWQGEKLSDEFATLADLGITSDSVVDASFALPPVTLKRAYVSDGTPTDEWRALRDPVSVTLRGAPRAFCADCHRWGDQGWGNRKTSVTLRLRGPDGDVKMVHGGTAGLWGIAQHAQYSSAVSNPLRLPASAELGPQDDIVKMAQPGDRVEVVVRVGHGGGHRVVVHGLRFRVIY